MLVEIRSQVAGVADDAEGSEGCEGAQDAECRHAAYAACRLEIIRDFTAPYQNGQGDWPE